MEGRGSASVEFFLEEEKGPLCGAFLLGNGARAPFPTPNLRGKLVNAVTSRHHNITMS